MKFKIMAFLKVQKRGGVNQNMIKVSNIQEILLPMKILLRPLSPRDQKAKL